MGGPIDFSQQEWEIDLLKAKWEMFSYQDMLVARNTVSRRGNSMTPCKDGYVIIILYEEHQWLRFIEVTGKEEWLLDERFASPYSRAEHGAALADLVADWAKDYTMEEIYHRCQSNGVPVGMVNKPADVCASEQLRERGFFVEINHPVSGTLGHPGTPYTLSSVRLTYAPAPTLGQHNEEVYCGRLGFTKEDLVRMRRASVI
jgi:crotonobetainyl-CoA:carnitine CoA-transferase CaiB-like acyl-CoA transferase